VSDPLLAVGSPLPPSLRRNVGHALYADDQRVVFVVAPTYAFSLAAMIAGGVGFILLANALVMGLTELYAVAGVMAAVAVLPTAIAVVSYRAYRRRVEAGADWPVRYTFDRRTGMLHDSQGNVVGQRGEVGVRRALLLGSRSVAVELVTPALRVVVYRVYTGGFSRGPEVDVVLARLAELGLPVLR